MNLWFPESVFFGTLSYSVLLTTTALLFYHMTRVQSLEMHPIVSASFAISLILLSIMYIGSAIVSYHGRLREMTMATATHPEETSSYTLAQERSYWVLYLTLGIVFMMIESGIAFFIIRGSLRTVTTRSVKTRAYA